MIHPKARIVAESGPVVIGEYNIIEELVTITNRSYLSLLIIIFSKPSLLVFHFFFMF